MDWECDKVGNDQTWGQQGGHAEAQAAVSSWLEPRMADEGTVGEAGNLGFEDRDAGGHRPAGGAPACTPRAGCFLDASEAVSVLTSQELGRPGTLLNIPHLASQLGQLAPASSPLPNATWGHQEVPLHH